MDEELEGEEFGVEVPPLAVYIKGIIERYPAGQIFKELIQNADDAGARRVHFFLDTRTHSPHSLISPALAQFQGPALLAYNDAQFTPQDWKNIQKPQQSFKQDDPLKVGKFGIGFNSVYHVTDLPTIISGSKVAFIEPFGKIWPGKFGRQFSINLSQMHATLAPFNGICEFSTRLKSYNHTLFRFPLRQLPSKLSETCYSVDMLHELLEALKEEAQYLLLFLRSVVEVQVFEISSSSRQEELFKIQICEHENISTKREAFREIVKIARLQHSQKCYRAEFHVETCDTACDQTESKHWLVVNTVGSERPRDWFEAEKLKVLPWAGCALELSVGSETSPNKGRIFCFLPMPKETCSPLPVHVNGTFGLNDDRRTLKWPSGERRHDPTANWNMQIINYLLPTCYAQLIMEAIRLGVSPERVYYAWPQIQAVRGTNWSGLMKPLLSILFQEKVFWSENASGKTLGSWVFLDNATFIPKGEELSSVVESVLSCSGLKVVDVPDHIWDAIDDKAVNEVSPTLLRRTLRSHSDVYKYLPAEDKHDILQYCLSDERYEDFSGLKLLPLANGVFHTFESGIFAKTYYVCSDQHPRYLLPKLEDHLVDLSSINEDLHAELLDVASSRETQLQQLDAKSVSKLLPLSMPSNWREKRSVVISGSDFPMQWFEVFWEWVQHHDLQLFTDQMVLPIIKRASKEQHKMWAAKLVTKSKVIFISNNDTLTSELLTGLEEIGLYFTGDSDNLFPYLQQVHQKLLSYDYVNSATPDGILRAIMHAYRGNLHSLRDLEFSDIQALELQFFISSRRVRMGGPIEVVLWLPIFKALNRKKLCSIESASRDSWNQRAVLECAGGFDISSNLLPPNLVVFSSDQNLTDLIRLYPFKVSAPTKADFIRNVLIPIISSNEYPDHLLDDLMVEILQHMLSVRNISSRLDLCNKLCELPFLQCSSIGSRKAPNKLFDISKKELKDLFMGKPVFPRPPFTQTHLLNALRECDLRQSVEAQEIVDIILSINTEPTSSTRLSRAKAVLRYLDKNPNCLKQKIVYGRRWYNLDATLPFISRQNCWLPVSVSPPEGYPDCLEWRGRSCTSFLTTLNSSALVCCEEDTNALSFIVGSQSFIVSCSSNLSKVFQNHVPLDLIGLHFQQVIDNCQDIDDEILHYTVHQTYKHLSINLHCGLRSILPTSWLWIRKHNVFISSQNAILHPHPTLRQDLDPYLFVVPEDLRKFSNLFKELGVVEHFTKSQALSVLAAIKHEMEHSQASSRDRWTIVMVILNWLTADGLQSITLWHNETLYVPIESESQTLRLEDSNTVCYVDDYDLKEYLSMVDEEYTLCHNRINHLAQRLGISPLSQHLDISDDIFADVGQHEPLDVRIRGILRDYTDGLTIIKELLQNADDAGATEVNLCFDARHHKTKPCIFPDMAKCYGPALIVHNNKVFTDEDFESITKLAGATKQNKPLKIGKFGVGFCSVYHITDVPSFVSREYFCVFDPTLKCLKGRVKDTSRPGKRIKFTRKCIKRSGLLAPYQGLYDFDFQEPFEGTMFRFPFRTSASVLSSISYNEHHVEKLIKDIQKSSSKLLLFLQNVQQVIFSQFKEGDTSPQILLDIQKHASDTLSVDTQLLKIECDTKLTRPTSHCEEVWLVSSHTEGIEFLSQERDGTASVACQLDSSTSSKPYTIKQISGEVFCFLPLSLQSGLPVHVSANFAVLNDRTGIRSSDEYGTGANEAEWNVDLMKSTIPQAYQNLLLCLSQMSIERDLEKDYSFYSLWPLKEELMNHNPWNTLIKPLYLFIARERLLYSIYTREWLTVDESKFLPSDLLCLIPNSSTPDCVCDVVNALCIPIIDLPSKYMAHLPQHEKEASTIQENEFVATFFHRIEDIDAVTRNATLHVLLRSLSIYPENHDLNRVLRENPCIPCSPDGQQLKKCHEIIDTKAPFAVLYTPHEEMFPEKQFTCSSTRPAMTSLGMITDYLPWDMLTERAGTIIKIMDINRTKAMQRAKIILKCINDNLVQTSSQSQRYFTSSHSTPENHQYCSKLQKVRFLPVQPHPKDYPACLSWYGEGSHLLSAEEIYSGEACATLAGSQVCLLCTQEPEQGGCGYVTRKVINGLAIKTQPPVSAVIQHFRHIIEVFISLRDSGKPQSMTHEWLDGVCSQIYNFLEEVGNELVSELCTLPCVWTGSDFVHTSAVALDCTYSGPYLFRIPNCLRGKSSLLKTFSIKREFTIDDIQETLKQMKDDFKENPISKGCQRLIPLLMTDLIDMMRRINTKDRRSLDLYVFLPDTHFVMQRASELAYNDAPWCKPTSGIPFVNNTIARGFAVQLGVQPVRSKYLEMYEDDEDDYEGEEFGQSEDLTQRIRNILRDYPLDITILKELLQNADDAKATKMYIILDKRTHGTKQLPSDEWKELQGPALLVWNDSTFREEDFKGIQKLGLGGKRSEAETIGMYGIGFNAVYHLTDCPSFISAEENGKSTLCVLDPHCRYIPGAKKVKPGRRFNNLDLKFWTQWSDLRSAYLQSDILGLPEGMKNGSLFRFPLRHEELFHKSDLVDHDSHSGIAKSKPKVPISTSLMQKYLREWCPDLKQALFFLNNVTELKVFEINCSAASKTNNMQLIHWFKAVIDDHAKARLALFQQKVQRFKNESRPCLERYTLTLVDKGLGGKEDYTEKWFIQQGIGDIDNSQQVWHFLPHMKPKHGIAAPLCAPNKASEMRRKSQLFCFLPLQVFSNLPVHVNGSFVLDSSRRKLWQSMIPDRLTEWNKQVLEAIASSYAEFLVQSQVLYIDPVNTTKKGILWNSVRQYYNAFPTWLGRSEHFPPPEDKDCLFVAKMVYHKLLARNAHILVHIKKEAKGTKQKVEYLPLVDKDTPQEQAYFWDGKKQELGSVLHGIGMRLTAAPMRILKHLSEFEGCSLCEASGRAVFKYYARFYGQVSAEDCFPQHISSTCFGSVETFKLFTEYILLQISEEEVGLAFPEDPSGLPLLLTSDNQLRNFLKEDQVVKSHFSSLFCQEAGEHFLHSKLLELRYVSSYFLQPSKENWDKIHSILAMTLPMSLNAVMLKNAICHITLLQSLWKCLAKEEIFRIHLEDIVETRALIPSTWIRRLSVFSTRSKILPIMPPSQESPEIEMQVFHTIQEIGMPIFDNTIAEHDLCRSFCPTLSEPHLVLQSLYHFYCQGYMQPFLSNNQNLLSMATVLLKYFSNIHLSHEPESLEQVKSLPLFKDVGGKFRSITGTVYVWPRNVCKVGQKVWLRVGADAVFLEKNGNWTHLGNADTLNIQCITVFGVYSELIFPVFDQLTAEERFKHLQHIRDQLFKDAETYSESQCDDNKQAAEMFILSLKKLRCLPKNGVLQPVCEFSDPEKVIFQKFDEFSTFPPEPMQDKNWLKFLRKIGLRTSVSQIEFLHLCHQIEGGKCSDIKDASTVLLEYLFGEKDWYTDEGFLRKVSVVAFVVVKHLQRLSKIRACAPGERRVQKGKATISLTALCNAAELKGAHLIWTVKPVVYLPSLPTTVQDPRQMRADLLHSLCVSEITVENVLENIINISDTHFSNFSNFDHYPQRLREPKHHSLVDVLLTNFKYLNDKCSKDYEGLSQLTNIPCIPVCAEGKVEGITCPVLVKPVQVIAMESEALKPFACFLNPLPQEFYSCLHPVLTSIGVHQRVTLKHVKQALEVIQHHTHKTLDVNTKEVVRNLLQLLQELLRNRRETLTDESDLGLSPLYLPNTDQHLVKSTSLMYEDTRYFKNDNFSFERLPLSKFSLLTDKKDIRKEEQFCLALPKAIAPKPLSKSCTQEMSDSYEEVEPSHLVESLQKTFRMPIIAGAVCALLRSRGDELSKTTQISIGKFFQNAKFVTVRKLQVNVYLMIVEPRACIGTAEVDFHAQRQSNGSYLLYVVTDSCVPRIYKSMAALILPIVVEMSDASIDTSHECEEVVRQLLMANNYEDVIDIMSEHDIPLSKAEEVYQPTAVDPNMKPKLGLPIPEGLYHRLQQNIDNLFRAGEWVGYEKADEIIVFAQVGYRVENEDNESESFDQYLIHVEENDPNGIIVSVVSLYKILRTLQKQPNSDEGFLVAYDGSSDAAKFRKMFDTEELERAKKQICEELERIWRLPEELRRRALKRMYLKWHPDKHDNKALAEEAFQFLLQQISLLEQKQPLEDPEEGKSVSSPVGRTAYDPWYETWEEIARRHGETRRQDQNEESFTLPEPQPEPHNARVWITQAEYDLQALTILKDATKCTQKICANVCFHAHEVAEKSLKAGMFAVCGLHPWDLKYHHLITNYAYSLHHEKPDLTEGLIGHVAAVSDFYNRTRWPNQYIPHQVPADNYYPSQANEAEEHARAIYHTMKALVNCMAP